jgi:hypothetical protein
MKWVFNDYKNLTINNVTTNPGESPEDALKRYRHWRSQFIEGEPRPVKGKFTITQLKKKGLIGLYKK